MYDAEYQRKYFRKHYGMKVGLGRFCEVMRIMGWTSAQGEAAGRPT